MKKEDGEMALPEKHGNSTPIAEKSEGLIIISLQKR